MSLEEFAVLHRLDSDWIDLRFECSRITARPDYWYRKELQNTAREFAMEASDILTDTIKKLKHQH